MKPISVHDDPTLKSNESSACDLQPNEVSKQQKEDAIRDYLVISTTGNSKRNTNHLKSIHSETKSQKINTNGSNWTPSFVKKKKEKASNERGKSNQINETKTARKDNNHHIPTAKRSKETNPVSNKVIQIKDKENLESKSKDAATHKTTTKDENTVAGFPILCSLCNITKSFKQFTEVIAHLYGQRHRRVGYKMLFLNSTTSISFRGMFYNL